MSNTRDDHEAAAAMAGGDKENGTSGGGGDNDTCLQLALEGEKLCKAGIIAFFFFID